MALPIYIATSSAGKLRDFAFAARAYPHARIEALPHLDRVAPPEETADSFRGNAWIKVEAYSGLAESSLVVADDSGLEVPELGGAPGVRSARFAADEQFTIPDRTFRNEDERNLACLLARAAHLTTAEERRATYRCALVAVRGRDLVAMAEGELHGTLLREGRGSGGFGYDPIFFLPELGLTMAEVDPETRLSLSHRGRALRALLEQLDPPRFGAINA